ncbi:MAG: hypothetical protein R2873_12700 [Caldilineaceae bacterium]
MAKKFLFCPYCATPLVEAFRFDQIRPCCPSCGFVQFPDPKVAVIALVIHRPHPVGAAQRRRSGKGALGVARLHGRRRDTPRRRLQREISEEVGLAIDMRDLLKIYPMNNGEGRRVEALCWHRSIADGRHQHRRSRR